MSIYKVKRTIPAEIEVSPYELAKTFCSMDETDQAEFFNYVGSVSRTWLPMQLQAVLDSPELSNDGRFAMQMIGDYGEVTS